MSKLTIDPLTKTARLLRQRQTEEERKLWARLRDRRLNGLKFRRQEPCGPYVADFLCEAAQLIVELDGSHHGDPNQSARDSERTRRLNDLGYQVLRIWNADLRSNPDRVFDEIVAAAEQRIGPSSGLRPPSPKGEGFLSSPGTGEDARRAGEGLEHTHSSMNGVSAREL
jgi:very-short-patch-repair endonuclease